MTVNRFIDASGRECAISDFEHFVTLVRAAAIHDNTLVFERDSQSWVRAADSTPYKLAAAPPIMSVPSAQRAQENAATVNDNAHEPRRRLLILLLYIVGFFLPAAMLWNVPSGPETAGQIAGRGIGYALFGWIIVRVTLGRVDVIKRRKALIALAGVYVLYAFVSAALVEPAYRERAKLHAAVARAIEAGSDGGSPTANGVADTPKEVASDGDPRLSSVMSVNSSSPKAFTGDMTTAMEWAADLAARSAKAFAELNRDAAAIGFDTVLHSENLVTAAGLKASRRRVEAFREYVQRFETVTTRQRELMNEEAERLPLSPEFKAGFLTGFRRRLASNAQLHSAYVNVARRILSKTEEILDFMAGRVGSVDLKDNQLLFETDAEAERYNELIDEFNQIVDEESAVVDRMNRAEENRLTQLKVLAQELE